MVLAGTGAHPLQQGVGQVHEGAGNKVGRVLWKSRECGWELFMEQIKGADSLPVVCVNISESQKLWMAMCSRNGSKGAGSKEKSWRMGRNPLAFLHPGASSESREGKAAVNNAQELENIWKKAKWLKRFLFYFYFFSSTKKLHSSQEKKNKEERNERRKAGGRKMDLEIGYLNVSGKWFLERKLLQNTA